jgi:polysaccharide export outer membrane protein
VINAVALAGGFTYRADQDDIVINRGGSQGPEVEGLLDTEVLPGDIINVTERFF